jgi:hypothetical protein
LILG